MKLIVVERGNTVESFYLLARIQGQFVWGTLDRVCVCIVLFGIHVAVSRHTF